MSLTTDKSIQLYVLSRIYISYPTVLELLWTDCPSDITADGKTYKGIGALMALTASGSELKGSSTDLTLTLSGIPDSSLQSILTSRVKAAPVQLSRIFFDTTTGAPLITQNGTNIISRYNGFVSNFSLQEEFDFQNRKSSNTMVISLSSSLDLMSTRVAGRKTNPSSQNRYFPTDKSMDRVPALENTSFDFGKKSGASK